MDSSQQSGGELRRRGAAAGHAAPPPTPMNPSSSTAAVLRPLSSSASASPPSVSRPSRPPSYAAYVRQVSAETAPLLAVHHLIAAAIATAANPSLTSADVFPLQVSAVLVATAHLAPWTASRVAVTAKSLTIPMAIVGLCVETLVRADRTAAAGAMAAAGATAKAAPVGAAWPPPLLVAAIEWRSPPDWGAVRPAAVLGWVALIAGSVLMAWTVALFYTIGDGTLSPEAATSPRRLVTTGPFRVSRNPMIAGVLGLLVGQAGVRSSPRTALYTAAFLSVMHVQIVFIEEPALAARFGDAYAAYVRSTPRWVPVLWRRRAAAA